MHPSLYEEMFRLESEHWWFVARRRVFRHLLRQLTAGHPERPRVLDIGSGCGKQVQELSDEFAMEGVEPSPEARTLAARRGVQLTAGLLPDQLPFEPGSFDAVLLTDVLEHVDDDLASLRGAARLLRPGGAALITVPALPWLWTSRDAIHQHRRRYSRGSLETLLAGSGLEVELLSWFNGLLAPLGVATRLWRRLREALGGAQEHRPGGDLWIPPAPLNAALASCFAFERHLLRGGWLPIGLSLLAIARRPLGSPAGIG